VRRCTTTQGTKGKKKPRTRGGVCFGGVPKGRKKKEKWPPKKRNAKGSNLGGVGLTREQENNKPPKARGTPTPW